jgi:hypothetical protein
MIEAKKLGADDIINVRIDRTDKSLHRIFDSLFGYTEKYSYTAKRAGDQVHTRRCGKPRRRRQRSLRQRWRVSIAA